MSYIGFLFLYVCVPLGFVLGWFGRSLGANAWHAIAVLMGIVYLCSVPWDNAAVVAGVWGYSPEALLGPHVFALPIEECLFFGLQTLLVGVWAAARLQRVMP